jgi:uncharacterized protein (DUF58 family)
MKRTLRIASVFAPPVLAGGLAFGTRNTPDFVALLLLVWWVMVAALVIRFMEAHKLKERGDVHLHLDVLTGNGRALMWGGVLAIALATKTGWASLAVLGVLGLCTACIAVTWTAIVAGGDLPWRHAKVKREILPAQCTEGDILREEVVLDDVRIPPGMRLFVQGRPTPQGIITRYTLGNDASRCEVKLDSDLGPAPRGEHVAPPLAMWLTDVLGLTRTPAVHRGEAAFTAIPRPLKVDNVRELLGTGGDDMHTVPTHRMPTEGTFRIREYVPGDDTRRIHWVRSLQANQLVVRLPDEIPQAEPAVRLVIDNCLGGTEMLTCTAQDELLDALVRIWLGVGTALADTNTRVTLAAVVKNSEGVYGVVEKPLVRRSSRQALQLGARVAWQGDVALAAIMKRRSPVRTVVVTARPRPQLPIPDENVTFVVVPEMTWTMNNWKAITLTSLTTLPYPSGSEENRWSRRRQDKRRTLKAWDDRSQLTQLLGWIDWQDYAGAYVARPRDGKVALEVVP